MNQVTTKKEGALAVNLFEADAAQGAQIYRKKILRCLS